MLAGVRGSASCFGHTRAISVPTPVVNTSHAHFNSRPSSSSSSSSSPSSFPSSSSSSDVSCRVILDWSTAHLLCVLPWNLPKCS